MHNLGEFPQCPKCKIPLVKKVSHLGLIWSCPDCAGRMVGMGLMRKIFNQEMVNSIWQRAGEKSCPRGSGCPSCDTPMKIVAHVTVQKGKGFFDLDVCRSCPLVWFDTKELETSLKSSGKSPPPNPAPLHPRAKEAMALLQVEYIRNKADWETIREDFDGPNPPETWWRVLLTIMGVPVEENDKGWSRWPWVTWSTMLLMLLGFVVSQFYPEEMGKWAFCADDPWKYGGLTLLTSFFLHASLLHLFVNSAFLGVFGTRCEDYLGHTRALLLLAGSAVAGCLLHLGFDPRLDIPLVGASAGISGVVAFYALQFPSARLVYFVRIGPLIRWLRLPAMLGFLIWMVLQLWGAVAQADGIGNVSFLGHLGGAVLGFGYWATLRFGSLSTGGGGSLTDAAIASSLHGQERRAP
jgi:membrane associated rhomboid family serine protease